MNEGCEELVLLDHVDLIVEEPITRLDPDYKSCYSLQAGFRIQTSLPFAHNGYKWRNVSLKFFQLRNVVTPGSCPTHNELGLSWQVRARLTDTKKIKD